MTGGELVGSAIVKGAEVAVKTANKDPKDRQLLREAAKGTRGLEVAGQAYGDRLAVRELAINKLWKPLFWFANYRNEYVEKQFAQDMASKLTGVPEENLTTPSAIVAAQALDGLSFSLDEPNLKDMYLNLLRTASDNRVAEQAHPSFASIIKSLSGAEAPLLLAVLANTEGIPMVEIRRVDASQSTFHTLVRHVLNFRILETSAPHEVQNLASHVSNWVRLGLVDADYDSYRAGEDTYDWVAERPEFKREQEKPIDDGWVVDKRKGLLNPTAFGIQFWNAVRPIPEAEAAVE